MINEPCRECGEVDPLKFNIIRIGDDIIRGMWMKFITRAGQPFHTCGKCMYGRYDGMVPVTCRTCSHVVYVDKITRMELSASVGKPPHLMDGTCWDCVNCRRVCPRCFYYSRDDHIHADHLAHCNGSAVETFHRTNQNL